MNRATKSARFGHFGVGDGTEADGRRPCGPGARHRRRPHRQQCDRRALCATGPAGRHRRRPRPSGTLRGAGGRPRRQHRIAALDPRPRLRGRPGRRRDRGRGAPGRQARRHHAAWQSRQRTRRGGGCPRRPRASGPDPDPGRSRLPRRRPEHGGRSASRRRRTADPDGRGQRPVRPRPAIAGRGRAGRTERTHHGRTVFFVGYVFLQIPGHDPGPALERPEDRPPSWWRGGWPRR